jgi:hypothetical protein
MPIGKRRKRPLYISAHSWQNAFPAALVLMRVEKITERLNYSIIRLVNSFLPCGLALRNQVT